jgi:hypothetical protein
MLNAMRIEAMDVSYNINGCEEESSFPSKTMDSRRDDGN